MDQSCPSGVGKPAVEADEPVEIGARARRLQHRRAAEAVADHHHVLGRAGDRPAAMMDPIRRSRNVSRSP
jgi:hypothetical protein